MQQKRRACALGVSNQNKGMLVQASFLLDARSLTYV